ncbi:MAG: hypothetical protein ACLRMJ_11375 [Alistipes finegoldii]
MKQAKQPAAVADFIHNMGIRSYIDPVPRWLSALRNRTFELVSAFSTFANQGVHTDPIFVTRIEDRQGNPTASSFPSRRTPSANARPTRCSRCLDRSTGDGGPAVQSG